MNIYHFFVVYICVSRDRLLKFPWRHLVLISLATLKKTHKQLLFGDKIRKTPTWQMLLQSCSTFYHSVIKPQDLRHSDLRDNCKSVHYCVFHLTRVMPIPGKNITNVLKMSTVSHIEVIKNTRVRAHACKPSSHWRRHALRPLVDTRVSRRL